MRRYKHEDVLEVLSLHRWKRILQIHDDLIELRGGDGPMLNWLSAVLKRYLREGLIEVRWGDDPEIIAKRGGYNYREYRITNDGLRRRAEIKEGLPNLAPIKA
jgi:hypothetical protein